MHDWRLTLAYARILEAAHWLIELLENLPSNITLAGTPMAAATAHAHANMNCEAERLWWAAALTCSLRAESMSLFLPIVSFPSVKRYSGPSIEDVLCAVCLSRLKSIP